MVRILWYYNSYEVDKNPSISTQEVFLTNHMQDVYAHTLNGIKTVLTLEQWEKMEDLGNNYFYRATYDIETKSFDPPIESWDKVCHC